MTAFQKWAMALIGIGALGMVLAKPEAFYKLTSGIRNVAAGSVVDVATGGRG